LPSHFNAHPFERSEDGGRIGKPACMANALDPKLMSDAERLAELGRILAAGLIRMRANKSSALSADHGESSVDFPARQSSHATRNSGGMKR
jgi:hypothetical protein